MLVAKISCPSCAATLKPANPIPAGKTVKCPKCATAFEVKGEEATQEPTQPPISRNPDSHSGTVPAAEVLVARFACPSCQSILKPANPIPAGRTVKCPKCANSFAVKPIEEKPAETKDGQDGVSATPAAKLIARFQCPHCQAMLKPASPMPAGKNIKCPKCSQPFAVPEEEPKPASESKPATEDKPAASSEELVSQLTCTGCKANLKLGKPVAVGKKIKCPKCQLLFAVPAPPKSDDDEPMVADLADDEQAKPAASDADDDMSPFSFSFDEPPATKKKPEPKKPEPKKPEAKKAAEPPPSDSAAKDEDKPEKEAEPDDEAELAALAARKKMLLTIGGSVLGVLALAGATLLALKILGGSQASSADWKLFEPKTGRCTVQMPSEPQPGDPNLEGIPALQSEIFVASISGANYYLGYTDLASAADHMTIDQLFQIEHKKVAPAGAAGKTADVTRIGAAGREYQAELPDDGGFVILRIYLDESQPRRLFLLKAEGPRIKPDAELALKFFDSFKITGTSTTPVVKVDKEPTGVAGWTPDPAASRNLMGGDFPLGPYKIRPPQGSKPMEIPGKLNTTFRFRGEKGRLDVKIEKKESPYHEKDLNDTLELFFKEISQHLGLPVETKVELKPTEEGFIGGVRFLRRRFEYVGDTGKGVGFIYVARDGPQTVMMYAADNSPNHTQVINILDTCVLTWRK